MIDAGQIIILASAGIIYTKSAVDMYRMASPNAPAWHRPALAVVSGILSLLLLLVATAQLLTVWPWAALVAQAILAGWLSGAGAVGVTALHNNARAGDQALVVDLDRRVRVYPDVTEQHVQQAVDQAQRHTDRRRRV